MPSIETLRRTLGAVDPDALSTAVAAYFARALPSTGLPTLDGETRSNSVSATEPQRHLLGVERHRLLALVARADVGEKKRDPGSERELATLPLEDADAWPTQTTQLIGHRPGEYLLTAKVHPPNLHQLLAHCRS